MRARIDLRPQSRKEASRRRQGIHLPRLVSLLLVSVFLLLSLATVVAGFLLVQRLRAEKNSLDGRVADLLIQQTSMTTELNRLKATEKLYGEALDLLRREVPALEFLASLEASLPPAVWLTKLSLSGESVAINGMAYGENDVVSFGRALTEASVVRSVGLPLSNRVSSAEGSRIRFDLTCSLNDLETVTLPRKEVAQP